MKILLLTVLLFSLLGCAPQPVINIPPQTTYIYQHAILDTSKSCRPSEESMAGYVAAYYHNINFFLVAGFETDPIKKALVDTDAHRTISQAPKDIEVFRSILLCVQTNLETELKKQTKEGWEVTSVQPIDSGPYELGVEYSFIVILRRQK